MGGLACLVFRQYQITWISHLDQIHKKTNFRIVTCMVPVHVLPILKSHRPI